MLGHATKYEVRIRRDASGKVAPPEKGGVLNAKNMKVTQKFNKEARGLFMVAEVKFPAGGADDEAGCGGEGRPPRAEDAWRGGGVRPSCASATARARTCLTSRCTPLLWGPTRTSLGPRGTGRRRRGPSAVLAEIKILGWGGHTGGN